MILSYAAQYVAKLFQPDPPPCLRILFTDPQVGLPFWLPLPARRRRVPQDQQHLVAFSSFPDSMSHHHPCHFSSIHDSIFSFCFLAAAGAGAFIYGYAFNRQRQDERLPRGGKQKLMVVLSYNPYSVLRPLLQILGPLCFDIGSAALDLVASHVAAWPPPSLGSPMDHPIGGAALRVHLPPSSDDLAAAPSPPPPANPFVPQGLFHKADLFAAFRGILLHLWTLWELMILGKPILLVAPTLPNALRPSPHCNRLDENPTVVDGGGRMKIAEGLVIEQLHRDEGPCRCQAGRHNSGRRIGRQEGGGRKWEAEGSRQREAKGRTCLRVSGEGMKAWLPPNCTF